MGVHRRRCFFASYRAHYSVLRMKNDIGVVANVHSTIPCPWLHEKKRKEFPGECLCCGLNRRWGIDVKIERCTALHDCDTVALSEHMQAHCC